MPFEFETIVQSAWIDYNGHMRDSYYGLVFSLAVDAFQDEVGFDATYRAQTGCTIYLLEDHKFFLSEVHEGDRLVVTTSVLDVDEKRFHLYLVMTRDNEEVCLGEFMELHVQQKPKPHAAPMPANIRVRLEAERAHPDFMKHKRSRLIRLRSPGPD